MGNPTPERYHAFSAYLVRNRTSAIHQLNNPRIEVKLPILSSSVDFILSSATEGCKVENPTGSPTESAKLILGKDLCFEKLLRSVSKRSPIFDNAHFE